MIQLPVQIKKIRFQSETDNNNNNNNNNNNAVNS